jgi:branched-chain amino acid transport system permease protein
MTANLFIEQAMNGFQLGLMLFFVAAGLTLVLGIMNTLNMTHGSFYMLGAYFGVSAYAWTGSFILACMIAIAAVAAVAALIEFLVMRHLYDRDHLVQLLATFGLSLFFGELIQIIWGRAALQLATPRILSGTIEIVDGLNYPVYRLAITLAGILIALGMYYVIQRTRLGMLIRAGASNRAMLGALGVNVRRLFLAVFAIGAMLAAGAGVMIAPLMSIDSGLGDSMLGLCFVVIVIGGLGSVRGAFIAAILIGMVDTFGRMALPMAFGYPLGPALASMVIYVFMGFVLVFKPEGILPARS